MKACILVAAQKGTAHKVAQQLEAVPGVLDAFPVRKRNEVVVRAQLRSMVHLAELLDRISAHRGVIVSETLLEIPQVVAG